MTRFVWWALLSSVLSAACGSDADVGGNYTAAITNRNDECSIGWTVGEQGNTQVTVSQTGRDVTLVVQGVPGILVANLLGTDTFTGNVDGSSIDLKVVGNAQKQTADCMYTFDGEIDASLDGDTLSGRVEYRAQTNGDASCGTREDCLSVQEFNATRPPPP